MSEKSSYDKIYSENEVTFGNGKPEKVVEDILKYRNTGSVLELGVGEGRNSLFLAEKGFEVSAQDMSKVGIEKISRKASEKAISIKTEVGDVRNLELDKNFDIMVSTFMLHHLSHEEALKLIKLLQEHTNIEGLNAITAFTKNGDFYRENANTENFYLNGGELKDIYKDWEILEYEELESVALKKKLDGSPMLNVSAHLLARKLK